MRDALFCSYQRVPTELESSGKRRLTAWLLVRLLWWRRVVALLLTVLRLSAILRSTVLLLLAVPGSDVSTLGLD